MPFHSAAFLLLLVPTFLLYYVYCTERWQHALLFISSFVFYYFAGVRDLTILLGTTAANFAIARYLTPRAGAILGTVLNLCVLGFFKYRFFLAGLVYDSSSFAASARAASIPLGISFYVFQLIAYQVDRARGVITAERSFPRLLLYILFFPHHQAGPIMRPATFLPQFIGSKSPNYDQLGRAVRWLLWGLAKKILADRIGYVIDPFFEGAPTSAHGAWSAAFGYSMQIYFDFSGYSDMAVGLGLLFGYELDRNFNQPYLAADASEFWQRWHITLSSWLRDYLYIPLGGNRLGTARTYLNLLATMALGGLWHGASWNFVVWGGLHGALLCIFRAVPRLLRGPRALRIALFQLAVVFCWIPFRARGFAQTKAFWRAMTGFHVPLGGAKEWLIIFAGVAAFMASQGLENRLTSTPGRRLRAVSRWHRVPYPIRGVIGAVVLATCGILLLDGTTFIYFRF